MPKLKITHIELEASDDAILAQSISASFGQGAAVRNTPAPVVEASKQIETPAAPEPRRARQKKIQPIVISPAAVGGAPEGKFSDLVHRRTEEEADVVW